MLRKRVIACLDLKDGRAIAASGRERARDTGDPIELAQRYAADGADEILFVDHSTAVDARPALLDLVSRAAQSLFIPLTVSINVEEIDDIAAILRAGADKISIKTAAISRPELITEASARFGKECVIAGIDARLEKRQIELVARTEGGPATTSPPPAASSAATWFRVFRHDGRTATELDAIAWAQQCAAMGAGEILVNSIDRHGSGTGYDLELTARVVEAVAVPVIASGGASTAEHIRDVFLLAGADAAVAAGIVHASIRDVKRILSESGIAVRPSEKDRNTV